ncbi:MAG: histidine kinase, partial [Blautia sp.]|nr:histidine kinase [Blautia sp.]
MNILNIYLDLFSLTLILILLFCHVLKKIRIDAKEKCYQRMLFITALILLCHAVLQYLSIGEIGNWRVFLEILIYSGNFLILGVYIHYLAEVIREREAFQDLWITIGYTTCFITIVLWILFALTFGVFQKVCGIYKYTRYGNVVSGFCIILIFLYDCFLTIRYRKALRKTEALLFLLLPAVTFLSRFLYSSTDGLSLRLPFTVLALLIIHVVIFVADGERLAVQKRELLKFQERTLLGALSPEVLHMVTEKIGILCREEPEKAKHYLETLSVYLREKMHNYEGQELAFFSRELTHARRYLEILELCFEGRIHVKYEIREEDFLIPNLTIQPLLKSCLEKNLQTEGMSAEVVISSLRIDSASQ